MDPTNADLIREVVECLGDLTLASDSNRIPEEFERKLKKSAIEQITDSTELRLLLIASLFKLRDNQREIKKAISELEIMVKTIDSRTKDRLKALRQLDGQIVQQPPTRGRI